MRAGGKHPAGDRLPTCLGDHSVHSSERTCQPGVHVLPCIRNVLAQQLRRQWFVIRLALPQAIQQRHPPAAAAAAAAPIGQQQRAAQAAPTTGVLQQAAACSGCTGGQARVQGHHVFCQALVALSIRAVQQQEHKVEA